MSAASRRRGAVRPLARLAAGMALVVLAGGMVSMATLAVAQIDVPLARSDQQPLVPGQDVTGQEVPLGTEAQFETVPQPRFESRPEGQDTVVAPQPRFVPAPGAGGIEVTPLAPPGADGEAPEGNVVSTEPGRGEAGAGVAVIQDQPDVLAPRGPDDTTTPQIELGGRDGRASRFRSAPDDPVRLTRRPSGPAVPIDAAPTELRHGVRLRELDKMTGQTETFELAVGDTRQVDRLKVRLEACRSPQGNNTHGTMAFLKVWDEREPEAEAFSGWMFAESPSLSAMDHPRYDLWVISCTTSSVVVSSPSE